MPYDEWGEWFDDPKDLSLNPELNAPNSTWNPTTGNWAITNPTAPGYDPTWGGYVSQEDADWLKAHPGDFDRAPGALERDTNLGWLGSVYDYQGWEGKPNESAQLAPPLPPGPPVQPNPPNPGPGDRGGGGGGRVPGTTSYAIPGGQSFFSYPDFAPSAIDYPDFTPPSFDVGKFAAPEATAGIFEAPPTTAGEFEAPALTAGEWKAPSWDVGAPPTLTTFDYQEFAGPTADTFQTDPGYDFRQRETKRAIQNDRSARGLLATGGTLQDLMSAAGSLASHEYGNVWNRGFAAHNANRSAAEAEHDRNEQAKVKAYEMQYGAESDELRRAQEDYGTKRAYDTDMYGRAASTYGIKRGADTEAFARAKGIYDTKRAADTDVFGRALTGHQTNYGGEQDEFTRALTGYLTGYGRKTDDWNRERDVYTTNLGKEATGYGLNLDTGRFNLGRDEAQFANQATLYDLMTRNLPKYNPMPLPAPY